MASTDIRNARFRVRMFGGLSIEADGGIVTGLATQRKALALLALLAATDDRGLTRDKIAGFLWPESDTDQARNALSQLLFRARRELGGDAIIGNGELRLNRDMVDSDLAEFERAIREGAFETAIGLYSGPFLDGFYIREASEFERWSAGERHRLQHAAFDVLETLANQASKAGNHSAAVSLWRRRAAAEPLSARVARAYLEVLVAAGDREAALRFGTFYIEVVRSELGANADPDVVRLIERIRDEATLAPPTREPALNGLRRPGTREDVVAPLDEPSRPAIVRHARLRRGVSRAVAGASLLAVGAMGVRAAGTWHEQQTQPRVLIAPFQNALRDSSLDAIGHMASDVVKESVALGNNNGSPAFGRTNQGDTSVIVASTYYRRNDAVEFLTKITNVESGRVVSTVQPVHALLSDPMPGLRELGARVEGGIASLRDDRIATLRDASALAPRFDAYQEFVEGLDLFVGRSDRTTGGSVPDGLKRSIPHFARAAQLDTTFNLPVIWLIFAYGNLGQDPQRDSMVSVLALRRDHLLPLDDHALDWFFARRRNDDEGALQAATAASRLAPGSNWTYMRALSNARFGRFDEAVALFRQIDIEHGWVQDWYPFWDQYVGALHVAGRIDEELSALKQWLNRSGDPSAVGLLLHALGAQGDARAASRLADSIEFAAPRSYLMVRPGAHLAIAAEEASVHGHEKAASAIADRCVRWHKAHVPDAVTDSMSYRLYLTSLSECLYLSGRWDEANVMSLKNIGYADYSGAMSASQLVLIAARRGDAEATRQRLAEAYARPEFQPGEQDRLLLDARLAALSGDAHMTATLLRRLHDRRAWHLLTEISPALRASRQMKDLSPSQPQVH